MNKLIGISAVLVVYGSAWAGVQEDDLVRLAQSGVDTNVLTAYINSAKGPYHLTSDQIIELKDLGVPSTVISEALRHSPDELTATAVPEVSPSVPIAPALATTTPAAPTPPVAPAPPRVADTASVVVTTPQVVEVYPYPYSVAYYEWWPYAFEVGWWWPGYLWGPGVHFYGRGYWHGTPAGFRSGGYFGRGGVRGFSGERGFRGGGGRGGGRR